MARLYPFLSLLLALAALHGTCGVEYEVENDTPNTLGGVRFDQDIGIPFTKNIMGIINQFIWNVFEQPTPADRKYVPVVKVVIAQYDGLEGYVDISNNLINVSAVYLQGMQGDELRTAFTALMYHEMTHVFQWSGNFTAPGPLTEGIADYMVLRAKLNGTGFALPGQGDRWDEGYAVTARFLEYCDSLMTGFTAALNNKMRYAYSEDYFVQLLGKPVDQLWSEYKAKYAPGLLV
ncbi:hypothetical protein RJ639_033417 [Escallonia herrerae]|uniref:Uncharacterized protein n=1 Tax=Escallonia herrerae TaxID=1293975 RepID=A0AA89BBG2_9ASTE|nr:hypothetical protein RJ639_033417 [Escallonia herrerae]